MRNIVAIIQARMASGRLPRKVMKKIAGKPLLWHVLKRAEKIENVNKIVVATSRKKENEPIRKFCQRQKIACFSGSEDDVLNRFYQATKKFKADAIVRLTADCPLLDPKVSSKVVNYFLNYPKLDIAGLAGNFPDGLDTEVFSFQSLKKAHKSAKLLSEREHVTPFMWKNPKEFKSAGVDFGKNLAHLRLTVDEREDLKLIRLIYKHLYKKNKIFYIEEVLKLFKKRPGLLKINQDIIRNEGYQKSLKEDKMLAPQLPLTKSKKLWQEAQKFIMDGTNLYSKGPKTYIEGVYPVFLEKGKGSHVWDVDGNEYIDYCMGFGSVILGYCYPAVDDAVKKILEKGNNFTLVYPLEVECAKKLCEIVPSAGMVRFFKTGGEACAAAVRIARAYTEKEIIIKGEYHGWYDTLMAASKRNAGIPKALAKTVFYADYNDFKKIKKLFKKYKDKIAAFMTEPVISQKPKFLRQIKKLCHQNSALLIFDEVNTGFRFSLGGAQEYFKITPDITVLGKGIANGFSLSAVVAKKKIMKKVAPKIFMSTTFGGETIGLTTCLANLKEMERKNVVKQIWRFGKNLKNGFNKLAEKHQVNIELAGYPPKMNIVCQDKKGKESKILKALFLQECVKRGILFGWAVLPSFSHTQKDLKKTLKVVDEVMKIYKKADEESNPQKYLQGKLPRLVEVL